MNLKFFYDIPYVKEIIGYLLIPFLIFIIICSIILLIYSNKNKDHENPVFKYRINLSSLLISILLVAVFLAILIGFSVAFYKELATSDVKPILSYLVIASPLIPIIALIVLFIKTIKVIKNKPNKEEINKIEDQENLKIMVDETNDKVIKTIDSTEEAKEETSKDEIELL